MVISQLPKIQIPAEEALDDEDKSILDAFKILLNGYTRSQGRLRAISKAYTELESIALSLLKEHNGSDRLSQKKEKKTSSPDRSTRKKLSPLQMPENDSREDILMVDLTYDLESLEQSVKTMARATSPVFGQQRKRGVRKNCGSEETESTSKGYKQIARTEERYFTKNVANQEEDALKDETAENNEENRPPPCNTSFWSTSNTENDSTLCWNESKPVAKLGLTKTVYSIDSYRTPSGKRSRQSILVFQPPTSKTDRICSEEQTAKFNVSRKSSCSLFDDNYREEKKTAKINSQETCQESHKDLAKDLPEKKSLLQVNAVFRTNPEISEATPSFNKGQKPEETSIGRKELSFVIETPSQIDETARSLFDDEDPDVFDCSKDLLNTCVDSPTLIDKAIQPVTPNVLGKREQSVAAIASTSKASQSSRVSDSIDETFFAPGEVEIMKTDMENMKVATLKSGCSGPAPKTNDSRDKSRNLKRKSDVETQDEAAKELGDFGVQDIDWDVDISSDNWPPPKRSLNDSFDIVPEKKKKSPNYAHKGKVERNKAERAKLRGWDCKECEKYYQNMNMPEDQLKKHMNRCSRHRSKYNQRYFTPEDFWNPVFPHASDSSDFSDDEPLQKHK